MTPEVQYIVVSGDLKAGFKFIGTFDDYKAAVDFIDYDLTLVDPNIIQLDEPVYS